MDLGDAGIDWNQAADAATGHLAKVQICCLLCNIKVHTLF